MTTASPPTYEIIPDQKIRLLNLQYGFKEGVSLDIEEEDTTMSYSPNIFRAKATLEIPPIEEGRSLQIGWIPVITDLIDISTYGEYGMASYEVPELNSGENTMISLSMDFPWFEPHREMIEIEGPTEFSGTITLNYEFRPLSIALWNIPSKFYNLPPNLSFVYKKQNILVYLSIIDFNSNMYEAITAISFTSEIAIDVDCSKPLRKRCQYIGPCVQEKPKIVQNNLIPELDPIIFENYLKSLLLLLWRPKNAHPEKLIDNYASFMDIKYYIREHRVMLNLLAITKENYLLQRKKNILEGKW